MYVLSYSPPLPHCSAYQPLGPVTFFTFQSVVVCFVSFEFFYDRAENTLDWASRNLYLALIVTP